MAAPGYRERTDLASLVSDMEAWGPSAPAVVEHRGVRRYVTSYGEIASLAHRFAAELAVRGIGPGERVVLWGANSAPWIAVFFGCVLRGVLPVPLDATGTPAFAERILKEVEPRLLVGEPELFRGIKSGVPTLPLHALGGVLPPAGSPLPPVTLTPDTPLQILFTSGTTGEPKGVVQTHRNLLASLGPIEREIARYRRYERWVHPLRFLHTLPLSHVFGQFMGLWVPPLLGATVVYESRVQASRLLGLIPRERIHVLAAVPRTLALLRAQLLAQHPALAAAVDAAQGQPLAKRWWRFRRLHRALGLRFWAEVCGGATLPAELEQFWTTLGFALVQGYGLTETAALVTLNHPFKTARGSLGRPLPGRSLRLSASGELEVRGEMVATARWQGGRLQSLHNDEGWLGTGDLAALDPDGKVRFLGRTGQRLVTAAGLNIYLQDVEQALEAQPELGEALVCSLEGEEAQVGAVVVAHGGMAQAEAAIARANASLAAHQQVRRWWLWPAIALPRSATGKVRRGQVERWARQQTQTESAVAQPGPVDAAVLLLRSLVPSAAGEPPTDDAAQLERDWGLDSMGRVALTAALEDQLGLPLRAGDGAGRLATLGDLRALIGAETLTRTQAPLAPLSTVPSTGTRGGENPEVQPAQGMRPATLQGATPAALAPSPLYRYPVWPWSWPVRWLRIAFQELVARPLVHLLAAPSVQRIATDANKGNQPLLLISNHRTAMDLPLLLYALPFRVRSRLAVAMSGEMLAGWLGSWRSLPPEQAAHRRWWGPPAAATLLMLFNVFPLPRTGAFRRSFEHAGCALDQGFCVLIFPEGRRAPTEQMLPFKPGLGILAQEAEAAVMPLALRIKSKIDGSWFRSRPTILLGAPIAMDAGQAPQQLTEQLQAAVQSLLSPSPAQHPPAV